MNTSSAEIGKDLATGDRNESYGHPIHNFTRIAQMWGAILGTQVQPEQVGLCMIAVKISRELHKPNPDNLIDICGYVQTVEMVRDYKAESEK